MAESSTAFVQKYGHKGPRGGTSPKPGKGKPNKIEKTMHEFKHGTLHSGSKQGPKVQSRDQAIAIALSQQRKANKGKS
jgi:hypothetical protein